MKKIPPKFIFEGDFLNQKDFYISRSLFTKSVGLNS